VPSARRVDEFIDVVPGTGTPQVLGEGPWRRVLAQEGERVAHSPSDI
jgi:hypothetical protein